jgi:hypothetical protein
LGWEADWKRWTHATYGLIQSVRMCEVLNGGNVARIEDAVIASAAWSVSSIGFSSVARRQGPPHGTIGVADTDVEMVIGAVRRSVFAMLVISTASVTEVLLGDLLVGRKVVKGTPKNFASSLRALAQRLALQEKLPRHQWALDAAHEMRIIRNVVVHASSKWSQSACDEFARVFRGRPGPVVGTSISVNTDDLFAYRRAARTVLNAAARA